MFKHKIELVTVKDIYEFVAIASSLHGEIRLVDGGGFCVNGKSLLGATATLEWNELYCISENDIYQKIQKFCTEA